MEEARRALTPFPPLLSPTTQARALRRHQAGEAAAAAGQGPPGRPRERLVGGGGGRWWGSVWLPGQRSKPINSTPSTTHTTTTGRAGAATTRPRARGTSRSASSASARATGAYREREMGGMGVRSGVGRVSSSLACGDVLSDLARCANSSPDPQAPQQRAGPREAGGGQGQAGGQQGPARRPRERLVSGEWIDRSTGHMVPCFDRPRLMVLFHHHHHRPRRGRDYKAEGEGDKQVSIFEPTSSDWYVFFPLVATCRGLGWVVGPPD